MQDLGQTLERNMIKSMTAFAREQHSEKFGTLTWELRSVNHRYLEVTCRMPEDLRGLEGRVREIVNNRLMRGKVECNLRFKPELATDTGIVINDAFVKSVIAACQAASCQGAPGILHRCQRQDRRRREHG